MKLSTTHAGVGTFVVVGLGVLAWTLLRPPDEVAPVSRDGSLTDSENVNMVVAPSAASVPPGPDALRPAPTPAVLAPATPAQVAVVPPASPEASPESLASQPTSQPIVALSNEATGDPVVVEPRPPAAASPQQNPYPSPAETHFENVGGGVRGLAEIIELDDEATQTLTSIMVEHVRAERALWGEAKIHGKTEVDQKKLEELGQRTLDSIRLSPELGDGMAQVVERLFVMIVNDPGMAIDPDQVQAVGVTELRTLAYDQ